MIEDSQNSQHSGQLGPISGALGMMTKPQFDEHGFRPQYSMPGILHFLQTEWARFEAERSQWEVERAELQARIAFLQGERKGQENLKQDLVRRIKMLEFALKKERAKYHKLKYGTDMSQGELKVPVFDKNDDDQVDGEVIATTANSNVNLRQGRQLLRQYLQEIGYTDTIIDVRSARVKSLLGIHAGPAQDSDGDIQQPALINGEPGGKHHMVDNNQKSIISVHDRMTPKRGPPSLVDNALLDTEASVLATFDFLSTENEVDDDEDNLSDENAEDDDLADCIETKRAKIKTVGNEALAGMEDVYADDETEEALAVFGFLTSEGGEGAGEARSHGDGTEWVKKDLSPNEEWRVDQQLISKLKEDYKKERKGKKAQLARPKRATLQAMLANLNQDDEMPSQNDAANSASSNSMPSSDLDDSESNGTIAFPASSTSPRKPVVGVPGPEDDALEAALGLGELAGLTVNNEADPLSYDIQASNEAFRKTWNAKYTLRSHFDGVRALAFHPIEPVLITASEDHTLKLWNLQKTVPAKKATSLDVEPVYTFRAHIGPVLCLVISPSGEQCYSGGVDSTIRCWNIPSFNIDPYDSFDPGVSNEMLVGHSNAVCGLAMHSSRPHLLSCSSDGTVKLWAPASNPPLLNSFTVENEIGVPTSIDFVRCDPNLMVASYTSSNTYIYDLETAASVVQLETPQSADFIAGSQINRVVSHPTMPITITAHEDRQIRFFDNLTGKLIHAMVAHLDAVTSLAVDPNGLYLLSGSHDCSIRLWNLESKTCVQEITSHRKKFDESIHDVAFHPSKPYIASAGADALAKVFV